MYTGSNWSLWLSVDTYTMWSLLSFVFWSSIHWSSIISLSNLLAKDMSWLSTSPAQHRVIDIPVVYSFRHEHEQQFQRIQYWYTYWMTIFLLASKSKSTPIISSIPNVKNIDSVVNTLDETNPKNTNNKGLKVTFCECLCPPCLDLTYRQWLGEGQTWVLGRLWRLLRQFLSFLWLLREFSAHHAATQLKRKTTENRRLEAV